MAACLLGLGYFAGFLIDPIEGGRTGLLVALAVWIFMSVFSLASGDSILLASSHAREITRDAHPQLFNIVEEMKIASGLPAMPRIFIMDEEAPNAFATGTKPAKSTIAVTAGLLTRLNRDELQGVIAHEMSHIMNRDVMFVTLAGVMLGSIALLSDLFLRGMWYSGGTSRRYRSQSSARAGGQAQVLLFLIALLFAVLAPLMARFFYFAISRRREYLADASAVRLTRYPEGLARALEKIAYSKTKLNSVNSITAPMYIENPLAVQGSAFSNLFSTHPLAEERIKILRNMSEGAGFRDYQNAFSQVTGTRSPVLPPSALQDSVSAQIRKGGVATDSIGVGDTSVLEPNRLKDVANSETREKGARQIKRETVDLIRSLNGFIFLNCPCGVRFKIPAGFRKPAVLCPRCGRVTQIPEKALSDREAVCRQ